LTEIGEGELVCSGREAVAAPLVGDISVVSSGSHKTFEVMTKPLGILVSVAS